MQKCKTKIPILILVHNSNDETNTVDRTYVIMEHAIGVPLHNKWHRMTGDQQVRCMDAIYASTYQTIKDTVDLDSSP
jgi:ABC-type lipopolysaccharide export system ATPase subunit